MVHFVVSGILYGILSTYYYIAVHTINYNDYLRKHKYNKLMTLSVECCLVSLK